MAKNPKFNNEGMFPQDNMAGYENVSDNTSKSEVLATRGNVINSLKAFWDRLREKLAYAVTRGQTSNAVGGDFRPVYVDADGEVKVCNASELRINNITNSNITISGFTPTVGQTLSLLIDVAKTDSNQLTINGSTIHYPSGVPYSDKFGAQTRLVVVYSGDRWILLNEMNLASSTNKGLMSAADKAKLDGIATGANNYSLPQATAEALGGIKTGYTDSEKNYRLQTDTNGNGYVNVPWKDTHEANWVTDLRVGQPTSTVDDTTSDIQDTYIKVVENGEVHGKVKVVGKGSVSVSSNGNGELEITGGTIPSYETLWASAERYNNEKGYLVYGPGSDKADTNNYLRGDGSWGPVTASMGKMTVSMNDSNVIYDQNKYVYGTLKIKYNGDDVPCAILHGGNFKVSDSTNNLSLNGLSIKAGGNMGADNIALVIPIGNLSLKPQIIHFSSLTDIKILD